MAEGQVLHDALAIAAALQRETDHRVKNTLQLVASLIQLQSRRTADDNVRRALRELLVRIAAVSASLRQVDRLGGVEVVDVAALVRELAAELAASAGREGIEIALDLEPALAPARHGAPLALIVGEAVANALQHAFPDERPGHLRVELRRAAGELRLTVADDGVGAPGTPAGFGMTLIQLMTQQVRGRLQVAPAQPGLRLTVTVPMDRDGPPQA